MKYKKDTDILKDKIVWIIKIENNFNSNNTLLLSKCSEAILPNIEGNHIGEGATLDKFLMSQKGIKFIINGGFNHYKKNFYEWNHNDFNIGDPVGIVKIRQHYFEDFLDKEHYGFFTQKSKHMPWEILKHEQLSKEEKYILGCTPMLIYNNQKTDLSLINMKSMPIGIINPPSFLGHGMENHPRTAVGIKNNILFFIVVEGFNQNEGCTLVELQSIGIKLELNTFLNLDGGGSSQFRLLDNKKWIINRISENDKNRVLGNVLVLFENNNI